MLRRAESRGAAEARQAREAAEARLHEARHSVVLPLAAERKENHVSARLNLIISKAAQQHRAGGH